MSWQTVAIGDVCELYQPQTITTKDLLIDGKFPVYGANGVIGRYDKYNHEESQLLVTCRGATCGSVNVSEPFSWINGNAMVVKPKIKEIDVRFIEYFFRGAVDLTKAITGAAQPQITRQSLSPIKFSYPSLSTQQNIVAKLDAIFAEIDKATVANEANAKNAEALFQSYLRKVFAVDSFWIESNLGTDFELYQPQTITTKDLIEDGKYQVYGANGVIGRYDKYNHEEPQLLVTCRGATCGAVNVSSPFAWINGNAMVVKPKTKNIDIRFTEYFFRGAVDLTKAITGAAQPQITRQSLSPIKFSYPPITTQHKIVEKLDILSEEIAKSSNSYRVKVGEFAKLKQSILKHAFAGQLVKE